MTTITLQEKHRLETARLAEQQARILREVLDDNDNDNDLTQVSRASAAGDTRKLRGIPALAPGVSGVSPGTHPEHEAIARAEQRNQQHQRHPAHRRPSLRPTVAD